MDTAVRFLSCHCSMPRNVNCVESSGGNMEDNGATSDKMASTARRTPKLTTRALEEALQRKIHQRRGKLGQLTLRKNELLRLMDHDNNLDVVRAMLSKSFAAVFDEFRKANEEVKEQYKALGLVESLQNDQESWFAPKESDFCDFIVQADDWIKGAQRRLEESQAVDDLLCPADSVSRAGTKHSKRSKSSTVSSERLKTELEKAALMAQASALKERRALEQFEMQLKAKREDLELKIALMTVEAKLKLLEGYEGSVVTTPQKLQPLHEHKLPSTEPYQPPAAALQSPQPAPLQEVCTKKV